MRSRWVLAMGALVLTVGARHAVAAPPVAAPAASAAAKSEARERFDRGLRLFEKGDNAAALAEFQRAYALIPNAVVLYNIGLVYAAMDRPVEATDALDRFLGSAGEKVSPDQRHHAQTVRDEQASRIARLLVVTDHPATIQIDGVEVGHTPMTEPLRLRSGAHTVTALAAGYQPSRREITFAGQVTEKLAMTLLPTESGAAHLVISTPLPGAEVWVNEKLVGTTPLPASVAVAPGEARVELKREGYRPASRVLHVDQGATAKLELTPEEDPTAPASAKGTLRLALAGTGSTEITVDGAARAGDTIMLPVGPHTLHVERVGFEPYDSAVRIEAGRATTLAVSLAPTLETRARDAEAIHGRRVLGGTILGAGLAVAAGAAAYVLVTHGDVSSAQDTLNQQLAAEQNPIDRCYAGLGRSPGLYEANMCDATKANDQDAVDAAKLKRILGYSALGLGVVAAGIGGYVLATAGSAHGAAVARTHVELWASGQGTGLTLSSSF